jgi:hypothetical protein
MAATNVYRSPYSVYWALFHAPRATRYAQWLDLFYALRATRYALLCVPCTN